MKQFRFMMMTALVAVMSLSAVSCSDDDDDVANPTTIRRWKQ